jgi:hypothetical protein
MAMHEINTQTHEVNKLNMWCQMRAQEIVPQFKQAKETAEMALFALLAGSPPVAVPGRRRQVLK